MSQFTAGIENYDLLSSQDIVLRRHLSALLNTQAKVRVIPFPENPEEYIEPTYGQCLALKNKNKIIILQQANGDYVQLVAGENRRVHRCIATEEDVKKLLEG